MSTHLGRGRNRRPPPSTHKPAHRQGCLPGLHALNAAAASDVGEREAQPAAVRGAVVKHGCSEVGAGGRAALGGAVGHLDRPLCSIAAQAREGGCIDVELAGVAGGADVGHLDHCRLAASGELQARAAAAERGGLWAGGGERGEAGEQWV